MYPPTVQSEARKAQAERAMEELATDRRELRKLEQQLGEERKAVDRDRDAVEGGINSPWFCFGIFSVSIFCSLSFSVCFVW